MDQPQINSPTLENSPIAATLVDSHKIIANGHMKIAEGYLELQQGDIDRFSISS